MSWTPEHQKALLAIERQTDIERLRAVAIDLLKTVALATRREEGNYRVVSRDGTVLERGSKEWCIGVVEGRAGINCYGGTIIGGERVMCGEFQVYPEWGAEP